MENNVEIVKVETKKETLTEKAKGFWEKHPKAKKVAKGVGLGLGALVVGTGAFLLGKRSCDVYIYDPRNDEVADDVPVEVNDTEEFVDSIEE